MGFNFLLMKGEMAINDTVESSHYEIFKERVIKKMTEKMSEDQIVNHVLPFYEDVIDSNKSYQEIKETKSLKKLFQVLECRDELGEDNILVIKDISESVGDETVKTELICQYEKLISQSHICSCCGESYSSRELSPLDLPGYSENEHYIDESSDDSEEECEINDVNLAIGSFASSIGKNWSQLARNLKLREGDIDDIESSSIGKNWSQLARNLKLREGDIDDIKFKKLTINEEIKLMFEIWKENFPLTATTRRLKKALRRSRRFDLISKLEKAERMND